MGSRFKKVQLDGWLRICVRRVELVWTQMKSGEGEKKMHFTNIKEVENNKTCIVSVVKSGMDLKMTSGLWLGLLVAGWGGLKRGAGSGKWGDAISFECIKFRFPSVKKWQCVIRSKIHRSGAQEKLSHRVVQSW